MEDSQEKGCGWKPRKPGYGGYRGVGYETAWAYESTIFGVKVGGRFS